jgi:hypothetical protein
MKNNRPEKLFRFERRENERKLTIVGCQNSHGGRERSSHIRTFKCNYDGCNKIFSD